MYIYTYYVQVSCSALPERAQASVTALLRRHLYTYIHVDMYLHLGMTQRSARTCASVCFTLEAKGVQNYATTPRGRSRLATLRPQHLPAPCHNIYKHILPYMLCF